MATTNALQSIDRVATETEAHQTLAAMAEQDGYLGGRVLPPRDGLGWRVQMFWADDVPENGPLPDGYRRVLLLESQRKTLGIAEHIAL
jgi:hypothetical protein